MNDGYRKTSNKNGGQWSGPCFFTNQGRDRFTIEPNNSEGPRWFCRKCSNSCQEGFDGGSYRYGSLNKEIPSMPKQTYKPGVITFDSAIAFAQNLSEEGMLYLNDRGLDDYTAMYFHLGMNAAQTAITIPLTYKWKGVNTCPGIKYRYLPKFAPKDRHPYGSITGSKNKGIFNFDALKEPQIFGIIANSLFDVMLLHQLGFVVIGPYAGEASWEAEWSKYIKWEYIINLGDRDKADSKGRYPGEDYMMHRCELLSTSMTSNVISSLAPEGYTDINAAYMDKFDVVNWINDTLDKGSRDV